MQVRAIQGDTVDQICLRHLGSTRAVVEQTLEMNPGLADHGPFVPAGLLVTLPAPNLSPTTTATVSLWD